MAAPIFTSAATVTFTVGTSGSFSVTTSPAAATITRVGSLPAGLTYTDNLNGTATIAGNPGAGTGGSFTLTLTATNADGSAQQTLVVTNRQAPAITSANNVTFRTGVAGTFTVTATGFPVPSIARGGSSLPPGVSYVDNGNGTGTLAGTPSAGSGNLYSITFTATNAVGSTPAQSFTITVQQAPAITSANNATFTVGSVGTFTVTTSGFPKPSIVRGGAALPAGVTFTDNGNGTGTLAGTPGAGLGGTFTITFTPTNVVGSGSTQTFTLTVRQVPAITSVNIGAAPVGVPYSFTITASGFPAPTIGLTGTLPAGLTFVSNGNGTGTLSGTPAAGTVGQYDLTFTPSNTAGTGAAQTFTLTISAAGGPIITSPDNASFQTAVSGTFQITTSGSPTPAIGLAGGILPSGLSFTDNGNGTATIAGTPAAGTGGTYTLYVTLTT